MQLKETGYIGQRRIGFISETEERYNTLFPIWQKEENNISLLELPYTLSDKEIKQKIISVINP